VPVPLVAQLQQDAQNVADALAELGGALTTVDRAPQDVNHQPVTPQGLLDQLKGAATDVHKAAQLKELLPVVIAVVGILVGKPVLGIALAVIVYYYTQSAAPGMAAAPAFDFSKPFGTAQ